MDKKTVRKISFIIAAIAIVAGLLIYLLESLQSNIVPADFTAARQKAAIVSQDIVNLTSKASQKIGQANQAQDQGNVDQLLNLISDAKTSNATAYQKAFDLSRALQQMAESLNTVRSPRQQLGYEAVAIELSLVSEFISYTGSLNDFLNTLAKSVLNQNSANQKAVDDALKNVNQKADLINTLNRNFIEKMAAFDQAG